MIDYYITTTLTISILKNILRQKHSQKNESVSLCNDSVIVTTICEAYNDSLIVTMIHETYNDLINYYNVSGLLIQRLFFLNRYNSSGRKIVSSEDLF
jgi:hypothetical protein